MKQFYHLVLASFMLCACGQASHQSNATTDTAVVPTTTRPPADDRAAMKDSLAKNPVLFLKLASKQLEWEVPEEPLHLAGPIYFVGTKGLASYLIVTPQGYILLYTGMPSSGPMIEQSIKKLGFDPSRIRYLLTGHAHIDHVGAFAFMKKIAPNAMVAIMDKEKDLIEHGGKTDFFYGPYPEFWFESVKVDRVLHDGDIVSLGGIAMKAIFTPGHTKGGTTWEMTITDSGRKYNVVFPDGTTINPGYKVAVEPSYPGIEANLRATLQKLAALHPDIWFSSHTEFFNYKEKRQRAAQEGMKAWIDPQGYQTRITNEQLKFEEEISKEKTQH